MKYLSGIKQKRIAKVEFLPILLLGSCILLCLIFSAVYIRNEYSHTIFGTLSSNVLGTFDNSKNKQHNMRSLDGEENENNKYYNPLCEGKEDYGGGAAVLLPILLILWVFIGLAVICDEFFQISLEKISEALNLSPDVAGATFLAAGSSAPELFTSAADAFGESSSIGMGTIVGSAMFNILVIVAASAAVAGKGGASLDIDYRPVSRDIFFYFLSIILLGVFFIDSKIVLYEAIILFFVYFLYIYFMTRNEEILSKFPPLGQESVVVVPDKEVEMLNKDVDLENPVQTNEDNVEVNDKVNDNRNDNEEIQREAEDEPEGFWERFAFPDDPKAWPLFFLTVIFRFLFTCTVPDCNIKFFEGWYWLAFLMSIVWIGVLCHFMVLWATEAACILQISPIVMGVLVLAVGTSVPDAIGSMIAAKNGEADMAIANAVGSNVFDILVGLGLPWILVIVIRGHDVAVCADGILIAVIILFCTACLFVGVLKFNKWKMNNFIGNCLLFLYLLYVIYTILNAAYGPKSTC